MKINMKSWKTENTMMTASRASWFQIITITYLLYIFFLTNAIADINESEIKHQTN